MRPAHTLFIGCPSFVADALLVERLARVHDETVTCLTGADGVHAVKRLLQTRAGADDAARVSIVVGDPTALDLGLSGPEAVQLSARVTDIVHAGAVRSAGHTRDTLDAANVFAVRNIVEFARECPNLARIVYLGSVYVSGTRRGVVREGELDRGQRFKNHLEHTLFRAERILRLSGLPFTVFRAGTIIGDSRTGEIGELDGPYLLVRWLAGRDYPVPLILPGSGDAPAHLVPVDYVVQAVTTIAAKPESVGHTFHLVDPDPLPVHRVVKMLVAYLGHNAPVFGAPQTAVEWALRLLPGLHPSLRAVSFFLPYLNHNVTYSASNTADFSAGTGLHCPELEHYFPSTVEFAVRRLRRAQEAREASRADDPLDADAAAAR